jgi:hypothetical protein
MQMSQLCQSLSQTGCLCYHRRRCDFICAFVLQVVVILVHSPPLFKEILEAVQFISSLLVLMEMIVMGKYVLIKGSDRKSIVILLVLMVGTPINAFRINEDHNTMIMFRVCVRSWSTSYVITHSMI